jgi:hypothetical protein
MQSVPPAVAGGSSPRITRPLPQAVLTSLSTATWYNTLARIISKVTEVLLSRLRPPKLSCTSITRIVLAAMLVFALLSGVAPFNSLSSPAQQTCTMSCCAGKPPHLAGSCGAAFSGEHNSEPHGDSTDHAHMGGMQMPVASAEIIEASSSHCGTAAHSSAEKSSEKKSSEKKSSGENSSRRAPQSQSSITAHALTTPCSAECAAAAAPVFTQFKKGRDAAGLPQDNRPLARAHISIAEHISSLQPLAAAQGRQSRPRPPPLFL